MKRFLLLVGVAAVAAAMYVAASPASQQASGPTLKQFNALKKQVAAMNKKLKVAKSEADAAVTIIGACYLKDNGNNTASFLVMPVSQRGNATQGYLFGTSGANVPTTALDEVATGPQAYLQEVDPQCATVSFMRRGAMRSGAARLQNLVKHTR